MNMEEEIPSENGDPAHEVIEDDGVEESEEDVVEVEPDGSIDSGVLVNGNDGEEHWVLTPDQ